MDVLARGAGYVALALTAAALLARAALADGALPGALGLGGGLLLLGGVAAATERERAFGRADAPVFERRDAARLSAVVAAALLTHALSVRVGLDPVLASALVGLAAGIATPDVDAPAYCGSFVGMASLSLFPTAGHLAVAGLLAGLAFVTAKPAFAGFGGKLGTLALFGCVTAATLTGADYAAWSALPWATAGLVVPVAVVGAVATTVLSVRLGLGPVVGSALVGLLAGLALPVVVPSWGGTLAAVAFCASFVGMSAPERLGREGGVALGGGLCGVVFLAVPPAFAGAGGKLGTVAFVSCVAIAGATELFGAR